MKALTIMSVLALTISGSAQRIYAGSSFISAFAGKESVISIAWKAN